MVTRPLALVAGLALAIPILADEPKITLEAVDPTGKPKGYKPGLTSRYAIWHDDDGWHFRLTTATESLQTFDGTIRVIGGRMTTITPQGTGGTGSKVGVPVKTTAPAYKFTTKINRGVEGGVDFTLDDKATALKFELTVNGKIVPTQIYLGAKGEHPKESTFHLPAKPGTK